MRVGGALALAGVWCVADSAGLTVCQMWQMPRASGLRGASGSRELFFSA